jgi:5-methylcytosine-specific restriction endonuclease McrA
MGGDPFSHANLQTLCQKCHKKKTKEDVGKMAAMNRICKEVRKYFRSKKQGEKMTDYWKTVFTSSR